VRVLEEQPSTGRAHYHVLIDRYIDHKFFSHLLSVAGFGKIYKFQYINSQQAFSYVAKYLRKPWNSDESFQHVLDYKLRLIAGSRGFSLSSSTKGEYLVICRPATFRRCFEILKVYSISFMNNYIDLVSSHVYDGTFILGFKVNSVSGGSDHSFNTILDGNQLQYYKLSIGKTIIDSTFLSLVNSVKL
jgi:hypothetical protein